MSNQFPSPKGHKADTLMATLLNIAIYKCNYFRKKIKKSFLQKSFGFDGNIETLYSQQTDNCVIIPLFYLIGHETEELLFLLKNMSQSEQIRKLNWETRK